MNILLDTHILIWALNDDPRLPEKARELILDEGNVVYYSSVSIWEVSIKHAIHPDTRADGAPPHHDPFDRMLISQAKAENMTFITHDSLLPYYQEKCIVFV